MAPRNPSPLEIARHESSIRIKVARDKIIETIAELPPEEQLEAAQAAVNALRAINERVVKQQQIDKLKHDVGI